MAIKNKKKKSVKASTRDTLFWCPVCIPIACDLPSPPFFVTLLNEAYSFSVTSS